MLKDSLPKFIVEMKEIAELLDISQEEINKLMEEISKLTKQFYVKSATYSIDDWEKEFGIEKNSTLSLNQRRAQILAKLNTRPPATVKMIENLVKQTLNADMVTIIEHTEEYSFTIYVQSGYLIENMKIADEAVHKARPAHLNYEFINGIIRNTKKTFYCGIAGITIRTTEGEVVNGIYTD